MSRNHNWDTDPTTLMSAFRTALLALIPVAEKVQMPWKEPDNYDDWDSICSTLYQSIVVGSVNSSTGAPNFLPFLAYDKRINSYQNNSYIGASGHDDRLAFICLKTEINPFDKCLFAHVDKNGAVFDHSLLDFFDVEFVIVAKKYSSFSILKKFSVLI